MKPMKRSGREGGDSVEGHEKQLAIDGERRLRQIRDINRKLGESYMPKMLRQRLYWDLLFIVLAVAGIVAMIILLQEEKNLCNDIVFHWV